MFYQIDDKFYVKLPEYYQELEVVRNNIVPKKGEQSRIYNPNAKVKTVSSEEVLAANKKSSKKSNLNIL